MINRPMSQVSHRRKCHRCAGRRYTDTLKISRLRELILFFLSRPPKVRANHPRRLLSVATLINFFNISKVIRLNCLAQVSGGWYHHGALRGPGLLPRCQPDLVHQHRHRGPQHHPGAPDLARGDQGPGGAARVIRAKKGIIWQETWLGMNLVGGFIQKIYWKLWRYYIDIVSLVSDTKYLLSLLTFHYRNLWLDTIIHHLKMKKKWRKRCQSFSSWNFAFQLNQSILKPLMGR